MLDSRRDFLAVLASGGAMALVGGSIASGQSKKQSGVPGPPNPNPGGDDTDALPTKSPAKAILEANEKDIKKNIERLYQLVTDLKSEVEKTDSSQVLSLALVKKAEEIERLARDIKSRAKG